MSDEKRYVRRIVKKEQEYIARQRFDEKVAPTQLYAEEKALVVQAVKDGKYVSISAFCREAIREKLERLGYVIPPESKFLKIGAEAEVA